MANIVVGDITPRIQYTATSGQTVFAYAFPIFADADLKVYIGSTLKTLTTHYTVSGAATSSGGNVTLVTGATTGDIVTIYRDLPHARSTDFQTSGDLLAETLNDQLDKLVMMTQQNEQSQARGLLVNQFDDYGDLTLPDKASRVGKVLAFNATSGDPEGGPTIGDVSSIAAITADIATLADIEDGTDATDAIQTVAGISANVTTVAGKATQIGLLGTTDAIADMNTLGTADVVADLNTLGTADVVADLNLLGTADVVSDMNTLATSDIVTDMNLLATSANVAAMALLGTSDAVSDMNTLGTSDVVSDLNTLATSDVVADMNTLGTADVVSDMNTLGTAGNVTNMNTLAGISANITTTAGISSDVTSVAGKATEIGRLGTAAAVADLALLGTADVVADMNLLATANVISDMNALATSDIISDLNTLATSDIVTDMNLLATSANVSSMANLGTSANVTAMSTVSGSIANVNTTATNIAAVNSFASVYRIASSAPTTSLNEGDLYFNTTVNKLYHYSGSAWTEITAYTHPTGDGNLHVPATTTTNNGKFLKAGSTAGSLSWAAVDALPSQSGHSGKYLTTDATNASWGTLDTDANTTTKGLYEMAHTISSNYSISSSNNAMSAGPITVNASVSVTIPATSTWVIV